jgi:hypothetical protein
MIVRSRCCSRGWSGAANLLAVHWGAVEPVADVLLTHGTVTGWLAKKVIRNAIPAPVQPAETPPIVVHHRPSASRVIELRPRANPGAD